MGKEPRVVANYLLYWKYYWKDVKNHPTDINFNWYTARKAFFNRVRANDNLWLVSSVRKPQPAKWALVSVAILHGRIVERASGSRSIVRVVQCVRLISG